jgi:hypothetical protein
MSYLVQARLDDHTLSVTTTTAKDAFATAIDWRVLGRLADITITDSNNTYSIETFSVAMALLEIARTVNDADEPKAKPAANG